MPKNLKIKLIFALAFFLSFPFLIVKCEECPSETTVLDEKTIYFVGQVADMGGDTEVTAWFEYGTSSKNYTQKTEEVKLTQPQKYCIKVTNLTPCTTYYYRAAMKNKAGESYGEEKEKRTLCKKVLGEATQTPTGISQSFFTSLFLPFALSILFVFLLKSHILKWEEFLEKKKIEYIKFKSPRQLRAKIKKIKEYEK